MWEKLREIKSLHEEAVYDRALGELNKILNDERRGILQAVNNYFADNMSAIRQDRRVARLDNFTIGSDTINMKQAVENLHLSNIDQVVFGIHDTLKACYKVALKCFTDNVVIQVSERQILGDGDAVKMLSPDLIGQYVDAKLTEIAGEIFATARKRNELVGKATRFGEAMKIAKQGVHWYMSTCGIWGLDKRPTPTEVGEKKFVVYSSKRWSREISLVT